MAGLFRVVRCPVCGNLQLTSAKKIFRCLRCGATRRLDSVKILYQSGDPEKAKDYLAKLKSGGRAPEFRKIGGMKRE